VEVDADVLAIAGVEERAGQEASTAGDSIDEDIG
jgi:hypothetical protein